jgi:hypothetical protein
VLNRALGGSWAVFACGPRGHGDAGPLCLAEGGGLPETVEGVARTAGGALRGPVGKGLPDLRVVGIIAVARSR